MTFSFLVTRLRYPQAAVVNSPPTVACAVRRGNGRGEIVVVLLWRRTGEWASRYWLLIWLITLISTYFFVAKTWWLPVGAAAATAFIDGQFALTFVLMGVVFLAAQLSLGYFAWRYREQPSSPPVDYSHGNVKLEIIWTVLTTILFVGLNLMGSSVWACAALGSGGPGCGAGGGYRDAVCVVLPLSGTGWKIWSDQPQADGSLGRW